MKVRRIVSVVALSAVLSVTVAIAWGQITTQDVQKIALTLRPYQVISGQVASTDYEVIYVLDNDTRKLAVLKYDWNKGQLVPIAGRYLAKDFGSDDSGGYSMVSTQLTGKAGLLYVTDFAAHKAIVYQVDLTNNTVNPQQPVDLNHLFGK